MWQLQRASRLAFLLLLVLPFATACRAVLPVAPSLAPPPSPPSCATVPRVDGKDTVTIGLTAAIEPGAITHPDNAAQQFVFARAYETLVRVDCNDQLLAGLATSWGVDALGNTTFLLREGAAFWNGEPATAHAVIDAWSRVALAQADSILGRIARAAVAANDRTIAISISGFTPGLLADPKFTVNRSGGASRWPEGTGPYRIVGRGSQLELHRNGMETGPVLIVNPIGASAARDQIDAGVDILFTDDLALNAYAESRPDIASTPLEWDRTWVLFLPGRKGDSAAADVRASAAAERLRTSLARDVVPGDVRAASVVAAAPATSCVAHAQADAEPRAAGQNMLVVFRSDDPTARAVAERIVALTAIAAGRSDSAVMSIVAPELPAMGGRLSARPLDPPTFADALRSGRAAAFVFSLPRRAVRGCHDERIIPLLDGRWRVITRRAGGAPQ